jgi:hypothetical protein
VELVFSFFFTTLFKFSTWSTDQCPNSPAAVVGRGEKEKEETALGGKKRGWKWQTNE